MIWYAIAGLSIFFLDFISKRWALAWCIDEFVFNKFLSCEVIFNRGVVWSLFHSRSEVQFFLITTLIVLVLIFLFFYSLKRYREGYFIWGEILVISGGFSNIFDRFMYGGVVDFIILGYGEYVWPVFNFADFSIFFGVLIMLTTFFRSKK